MSLRNVNSLFIHQDAVRGSGYAGKSKVDAGGPNNRTTSRAARHDAPELRPATRELHHHESAFDSRRSETLSRAK